MDEEPDIIQMENLFYSEPQSSEKQLFLAVILQALLDLSKDYKSDKMQHEKDRAKAWFFTEVGVTCKNFETVCDMAGMNIERTRSFAYKVMNSDDKDFLRIRIRKILHGEDTDGKNE